MLGSGLLPSDCSCVRGIVPKIAPDCSKQFIACSKQSEGSNPNKIAPSNLLLGALILLNVLEILLLSIFIACRPGMIAIELCYGLPSGNNN